MRLVVAGPAGGACDGEIAPRGVSLAVKGPPWIPLSAHFDREVSLSTYDLEQLASAGVNMIRLGAMMPGVLPNPPVDGVYRHGSKYVEELKGFVERAASYGMYTLIEFHQDVISQYYCGEGLPRWAADEVHEAFPAEFEDEVLELLHRMSFDIPVLDAIEDHVLRRFVRSNVPRARFPMPVADPFDVLASGPRVYTQQDCDRYEWFQYQMSFTAGTAYRRLFNLSSSTFQHVHAYWKILAEAFLGDPNVLAFDLFNEPHPGSLLTEPWLMAPEQAEGRLAPFYSEIARAIHSIDPERLITFSPVTWEEGGYYLREVNGPAWQMCEWLRKMFMGMPLPGCETVWDITRWLPARGIESSAFSSVPLPGQSILSFHFYTPPELNHEAYARKRKADAQRLQAYPLLSETCCLRDADALQRLYWFEDQQIGWTMWEYKHMADGRGYGAGITGTGPSMFHDDGTPIKAYWRRLAHPSAQFVRGEVLANIFDFTVGTFNLTFVPSSDCHAPGPDAIIVWPWTWWAYINITSMPKIRTSPPDAAIVREYAGGSEGFATPVVRFAVQVLQWDQAITVTLSFLNFRNMDLVPEAPEPSVFGPWYQGTGWLGAGALAAAAVLRVLTCCCGRRGRCGASLCCCCCCCCCRELRPGKDIDPECSDDADDSPPVAAYRLPSFLSVFAPEIASGAYTPVRAAAEPADPEPEPELGTPGDSELRSSRARARRLVSVRATPPSEEEPLLPPPHFSDDSPQAHVDLPVSLLDLDPASQPGDAGL